MASSVINKAMKRVLKLLLKSSPFLVGVAHVCDGLEQKQQNKFSLWRILLGVLGLSALILLSSMIYVKAYYDATFEASIDGCAVVFGAAVWKGNQPSNALSDRTQAAIDLYQKQQVSCLVLSGGASKYGAHEVAVMQRLAREAGIPNQDLYLDYEGNNTLGTLYNLPQKKSFVMVSNDFHLARINLMAKRLDVPEFYVHAAPYEYGRYNKDQQYYLREVAGTLVTWFGL